MFQDLFRSAFLGEFLTVLMNNLVEKTHALLVDEIATAVYNMAAVDFNTYFNSFIPHFLSQLSGLDSYQREMLHQRTKPDMVNLSVLLNDFFLIILFIKFFFYFLYHSKMNNFLRVLR